jgi:hypothetical protein
LIGWIPSSLFATLHRRGLTAKSEETPPHRNTTDGKKEKEFKEVKKVKKTEKTLDRINFNSLHFPILHRRGNLSKQHTGNTTEKFTEEGDNLQPTHDYVSFYRAKVLWAAANCEQPTTDDVLQFVPVAVIQSVIHRCDFVCACVIVDRF